MNLPVISIDPGHYKGYNAGVVDGYFEGTAMFTLAVYLKEALEKFAFPVYLTKQKVEEDPSLTERGTSGALVKVDLKLSLHSNGIGDKTKFEKACGVSGYRSIKKPNIDLYEKLLNAIVDCMKPETGVTYSRGVLTRESEKYPGQDYYTVVNKAASVETVDAVLLIEHGFHTNSKECKFLSKDENLRKLAEVEAKTIAEYYGATLVSTEPEQPKEDEKDEPSKVITCNAVVQILVDVLNIRDKPDTSGKDIGDAKKNAQYQIDAVSNGWGRIKNTTKWINCNAKYVKIIKGSLTTVQQPTQPVAPVTEKVDETNTRFLVSTKGGAKGRKEPNATSTVVCIVPAGTYTVIAEKNGYYKFASGYWVLKTLVTKK